MGHLRPSIEAAGSWRCVSIPAAALRWVSVPGHSWDAVLLTAVSCQSDMAIGVSHYPLNRPHARLAACCTAAAAAAAATPRSFYQSSYWQAAQRSAQRQ